MKKILLSITITCMSMALYAQSEIIHKTFDESEMAFPTNANIGVDMDEDGRTDFYINLAEDQLGLTGIINVGCFPTETFDINSPTQEFAIFEEGELIHFSAGTPYSYFEDTGTLYTPENGMASNVPNQEDFYIGVALMSNTTLGARNGWIKIELNVASNLMTIKEWAYNAEYQELTLDNSGEGIKAGDTGAITNVSDILDVQNIVTSPNPASGQVNIQYEYAGEDQLTLSAYSSLGQLVYSTQLLRGEQNIRINTQDWNDGNYMLRFTTDSGIKTQLLVISK